MNERLAKRVFTTCMVIFVCFIAAAIAVESPDKQAAVKAYESNDIANAVKHFKTVLASGRAV